MCTNITNTTNPNQEQEELLLEQQKLITELSELQEWINTRMTEQLTLYNTMVVNYDRMLTKLRTCEEELERNRTENTRFKFTSQCLIDKINELTTSDDNKSEKVNNDDDQDKDKNPNADPLTGYMEVSLIHLYIITHRCV